LRCNGHVINLAAQAFLFQDTGRGAANPLAADNNDGLKSVPTEQEIENWRKKGSLGRLHNIVVSIQRSTQRIERFKALSEGKVLIRDNSTRWNSWYKMTKKALTLREAIELYCLRYKENQQDLRKFSIQP
jgi:hypothetical protein